MDCCPRRMVLYSGFHLDQKVGRNYNEKVCFVNDFGRNVVC